VRHFLECLAQVILTGNWMVFSYDVVVMMDGGSKKKISIVNIIFVVS
jgi:hypothetical protein